MIDTETPRSPGWWLKGLAGRLTDRRIGRAGTTRFSRQTMKSNRVRPGLDLLEDYAGGDPPLQQVATEWQGYVREFIRKGRLNIADLLVSSTANRMQLRDFRTSAANDELGDASARELMRANDSETKFRDVHEGLLTLGDAYAIVAPPDRSREQPLMTAESATEVITAHDPATGERLAALKLFRDEWDSADFAYVFYFEDGRPRLRVAVKKGTTSITSSPWRLARSWEWDDELEQPIPGSRIPVVRYRNRRGVGEFEQHLGTLDRINDKIANEWWIGKIQAFRQRAVKNLPDEDERTGEPIDWTDIFVADPGAMWKVPGDTEFWESQNVDVTPVINSIKHDLERLAAATSTMLHTITPDAAAGSAEGAALMREEHNFKVEDRRTRANGSHAETMSLMLEFSADPDVRKRSDRGGIEPIWGPVERFSLQQKSDATSKLWGKLPSEAIYTDVLQYPPADVPNLRQLRGRDLLFNQQTLPQPAQPPQPATGEPEGRPQPRSA